MAPSKSILITGCSQGGIGDALAREFHRRGLRVFATARTLSKIAHLSAMGIETLPLDVTSASSIASAVEQVSALNGGKLDYLLNNSGAGYSMPVTDVDISEAKKLFDVNVFAVIAVTNAFMPLLIKASPNGGGTVINNSSIVTVAPLPFLSIYNASKAAARTVSHNMRMEFKPLGVKVVDIMTGSVSTKFFDNANAESVLSIPQNSYYAAAKREVEFAMAGKAVDGKNNAAMDVDVYARKVVSDLLKSVSGSGSSSPAALLWRGQYASTIWFLTSFFPGALQAIIMGKLFGMDVVSAKVRKGKLRMA